MKHTLLSVVFLSTLSTLTYADTVTPKPATTEKPATMPATKPSPAPSTPITTATQTTTAPTQAINCQYHIPAATTTIDTTLITTWAKQATVQAFEFNPANIDQELAALKSCFTEQGWKGFNEALQKSDNINAIKSQQLTVSSQISGDVTINPVKDNQWKLIIPLQVVYQNDKEKLSQKLIVNLLIGRQISGDLGIMQMIAAPQKTTPNTTTDQAATPTKQSPGATLETPVQH